MAYLCDKLVLHVILTLLITNISCERHTIYWDTRLEPRLKDELNLEVKVNDWMDILCPHKSSFNRSAQDSHNLYLEVYNVSAAHYKHCAVTGQQRLLHCKNPRKEVKLTTKFQLRSPSPIGFIFRPGHTYYYVSKPIQGNSPGCNSDTMRMKITVKERTVDNENSNNQRHLGLSNKFTATRDSSETRRHHYHKKTVFQAKKPAVKNPLQGSENIGNTTPPDGKTPPGNLALSALRSSTSKIWFPISCLIWILIDAVLM